MGQRGTGFVVNLWSGRPFSQRCIVVIFKYFKILLLLLLLSSLRKYCTFYSMHFPWHPKVLITFWMLSRTGKGSNSCTYQQNIPGHLYCLWSGGLTKHTCFVCKWCLSVGVCLWLSVNKIKTRKWSHLVCLIRHFKLFILLLWILKYILAITITFDTLLNIFKTKYLKTFTQVVFYWVTHFYLSHFLFRYLYFSSSMTIGSFSTTAHTHKVHDSDKL